MAEGGQELHDADMHASSIRGGDKWEAKYPLQRSNTEHRKTAAPAAGVLTEDIVGVQTLCSKIVLQLDLKKQDTHSVDSDAIIIQLPMPSETEAYHAFPKLQVLLQKDNFKLLGNLKNISSQTELTGSILKVNWTCTVKNDNYEAQEALGKLLEAFKKHCSQLVTFKISLQKSEIQSSCQSIISSLLSKISKAHTEILLNKGENTLLVVCPKEHEIETDETIKETLKNVEDCTEVLLESVEHGECIDRFDFRGQVKKLKNVKIIIEGKKVKLVGSATERSQCHKKLQEFLKNIFTSKSECLSKIVCDVFCLDGTKEYVNDELQKKKVECIWSVEGEERVVNIFSDKKYYLERGIKYILSSVTGTKIGKNVYCSLKHDTDFVKLLQEEKDRHIITENQDLIEVAGTEGFMNSLSVLITKAQDAKPRQGEDKEFTNNLSDVKSKNNRAENISQTATSRNTSKVQPKDRLSHMKSFQVKTYEIELLKLVDFIGKWKDTYPKVEIEVDGANCMVYINGGEEVIKKYQEMFKNCISDLKTATKKLSLVLIKFLSCKGPREYVNQTLAREKLVCCWYCDSETILVYAENDKDAVKACHLIRNCITEHHITNKAELQKVVKTQKYHLLVEKYFEKFMTFIPADESEGLLCLTDDISTEVIEEVAVLLSKATGIVDNTVTLSSSDMMLVRKFENELKAKTEADFSISTSGDQIRLACSRDDKDAIKKRVICACKEIKEKTKRVTFSADFTVLLECKETSNYIDKKLQQKKLDCKWYHHDGVVIVFADLDQVREDAVSVIEKCLKAEEYSLSAEIFESEEVKNFINGYKGKAVLNGPFGEEGELMATADVFSEIEEKLLHLSDSVMKDSTGSSQICSMMKYILMSDEMTRIMLSDTNDRLNQLKKKFNVKFKKPADIVGIVVEGPKASLQKVEKEIVKYIDENLTHEELYFDPDTLQSAILDDQNGFEMKHNCALSVKRCTENAKPKPFYIVNEAPKSNVHVMFCDGNIEDTDVDIIVCPTDKHFQPLGRGEEIYAKAGNDLLLYVHKVMAQRSKDELTKLDVTDMTGNLRSPFVMLLPLSVANAPGSDSPSDVSKDVERAFTDADSKHFYSIAIPMKMVSAKDLLKMIVPGILKGIKSTCKSLKCLREIYLYTSGDEEVKMLEDHIQIFSELPPWTVTDCKALFCGKEYDIGAPLRAEIIKGSLIQQKVDLIVNSVSWTLELEHGLVSRSILHAAGSELQKELKKQYPSGIRYGELVVTRSFKIMTCKEICHVAMPFWNPTGNYSLWVLQLLMDNCLRYADSKKYKSVAFPVIGTGNLGYPWKLVAETMLDTVENFGRKNQGTSVNDVKIVIYDKDQRSFQAFQDADRKEQIRKQDWDVPDEVLESRIPLPVVSVKIQIHPKLSVPCSTDARVTFSTDAEILKGREGKVDIDKFYCLENDGIYYKEVTDGKQPYTMICVCAETSEKKYKEKISKCLEIAQEARATSLYFEIKEIKITDGHGREKKAISCTEQCNWIKCTISEYVYAGKVKMLTKHLCYLNEVYMSLENGDVSKLLKPESSLFNIFRNITGNKELPWKCIKFRKKLHMKNYVLMTVVAEKTKMDNILKDLRSLSADAKQERPFGSQSSAISVIGNPGTPHLLCEKDIFTSISGEIHPSIMKEVKDKDILKKALGDHVKFDRNNNSKIITITLQQMEEAENRLRQFTSLDMDENHFASSNNRQQDQDETFVNIQTKKLDISEENMLALQFFCEGENWWHNVISKKELEIICNRHDEITITAIDSKIKVFALMNKMEVPLNSQEQSMTHTAIADVHDNVPGVLCYQLRDDKDKFLRLMGDNYNTLQQAKHRISLVFGRIKQSDTRKNRRFEAKPIADKIQEDNDSDNDSTSTRTSSFYRSTSPNQSAANFATKEGLDVRVYSGSILHLDVDCIVNAANENLQHGGGIAFVIARAAGYEFDRESRDYVSQHGSLNVGECCTTTAGDLKYKGVIHTVGPRWYDYPNDQIRCLDDLTQAVKAVMIECDYQRFTTVAIPAISSGIFGVPQDLCAQQYYRAVTEYSAQDWDGSSSLKEVHFVDKDQGMVDLIARTFSECCKNDRKMKKAMLPDLSQTVKSMGSKTFSSTRSHGATLSEKFKRSFSSDSESSGQPLQKSFTKKESENCCICMDDVTDPKKLKCGHTFCRDCIEMQFQYKPVCPSCGAVYGKIIGDQPEGTMKISASKYGSLQGYEGCGIITISYYFPPGKQGPDHPQPGQPYEGISRGAYLPNNERGKLVSKLLKIAFDRKLVFTIGRSRTTGKEGVVTWNDIHHKTRMDGGPPRFGYPDPTYLDRVMEELEVKGVTEDSLNDP